MATPARLIVFDLDGTLVDSLSDIAGAMNALLREIGAPEQPLSAFRRIVGDGSRVAVMRATEGRFDDDPERVDALNERYLEIYRERGSPESRAYEGVTDLVGALEAMRPAPRLAVLTNKPHDIAMRLVDEVFGLERWLAVEGVREGLKKKPDPSGLLGIIRMGEVSREETLYVGDTNTDMRTGRAAAVRTIGVTWGFRTEQELRESGANAIIDAPRELLEHVTRRGS